MVLSGRCAGGEKIADVLAARVTRPARCWPASPPPPGPGVAAAATPWRPPAPGRGQNTRPAPPGAGRAGGWAGRGRAGVGRKESIGKRGGGGRFLWGRGLCQRARARCPHSPPFPARTDPNTHTLPSAQHTHTHTHTHTQYNGGSPPGRRLCHGHACTGGPARGERREGKDKGSGGASEGGERSGGEAAHGISPRGRHPRPAPLSAMLALPLPPITELVIQSPALAWLAPVHVPGAAAPGIRRQKPDAAARRRGCIFRSSPFFFSLPRPRPGLTPASTPTPAPRPRPDT